jgi:hypothetical protein
MKTSIIAVLLLTFTITTYAQAENPKYNKALADSLGANDYGMKPYVLVILKTGSNKTENKETTDSLFNGHMASIVRLVNAGKLIVSGPLANNDSSYRGIFILNVKTIPEAKELLTGDPAIKAKILDPELFVWYGSAALPLYLKSHELIEKKKF